jgi:phosphorylcholine metabolism protein LicD
MREQVGINYGQQIEKYVVDDENYKSFCFPYVFINGLYDVVKYTKELCERENIEYFIDGGTLLGCVRDGGQILYDNDADFGVTMANFKKLLKFKDDFLSKNFSFNVKDNCKIQIENKNMYIVHNKNCRKEGEEPLQLQLYPGLDVLIYKPIMEGHFTKFVIHDNVFRNEYPYAFHYKKHLYPLVDYTYKCLDNEPIILKGANNPVKYLDGTYPNWKTQKIYDHKTYIIMDS